MKEKVNHDEISIQNVVADESQLRIPLDTQTLLPDRKPELQNIDSSNSTFWRTELYHYM